jgi:carboxyl-terminal processing protease
MAGLFIEDGPICQVKGRDERAQVLRDKDKNVLYDGPLAVMVDETSASASEIFAAAIQDYKRGVIIGSTSTYGKGTVQRNIPLNPNAGTNPFSNGKDEDLGTVKLTLQKFYRINGDATQQRGVVPDIILPDKLEFFKIREKDNPMALKYDEIEKADYKTWTSTYSEQNIVSTANTEANTNTTFGKIRSNMEWLDKNADREYSLNITKYKADQKAVRDVYKQVDDLYKLPKPLTVTNLASDTNAINKTKEKVERNKDFVKKISSDIYVDETVKVLNKMIVQTNIAKANGKEVIPAN